MGVFDIAVLDTNFFIAMDGAGIGGLLPKLQFYLDTMKVKILTSAEIPRSDVPAQFRPLRTTIPKHVTLIKVDRNDPVWKDIARTAKTNRMIAWERDPADIDVCYLGLKYAKQGKKVACVSDDVGVARVCKEVRLFMD